MSDERNLYDAPSENGYAPFSSVYLVGGRPAEPVGLETNRIARIQSHSHQALKEELCRVIDLYQPAVVVVEHMELAGVINISTVHRPKFILSLQDVLLSPSDSSQAEADRFESALIDRFVSTSRP